MTGIHVWSIQMYEMYHSRECPLTVPIRFYGLLYKFTNNYSIHILLIFDTKVYTYCGGNRLAIISSLLCRTYFQRSLQFLEQKQPIIALFTFALNVKHVRVHILMIASKIWWGSCQTYIVARWPTAIKQMQLFRSYCGGRDVTAQLSCPLFRPGHEKSKIENRTEKTENRSRTEPKPKISVPFRFLVLRNRSSRFGSVLKPVNRKRTELIHSSPLSDWAQ